MYNGVLATTGANIYTFISDGSGNLNEISIAVDVK
jgi:hypothetical protein